MASLLSFLRGSSRLASYSKPLLRSPRYPPTASGFLYISPPNPPTPPSIFQTALTFSSSNKDSVLEMLRSFGFSDFQVAKILKSDSGLLSSDPHNTILPKLDFLVSKSFPKSDILKIISSCPSILSRSLENQLFVVYDFLKSVLHHDMLVVVALTKAPRLFLENIHKNIAPNVSSLQRIGVPHPSIEFMMQSYPSVFHLKEEKFSRYLEELQVKYGFNPTEKEFVKALKVYCGLTAETFNKKAEIYQSYGWNEEEVISLFRSNPTSMAYSERNLKSTIQFLMKEMGWSKEVIGKRLVALGYNLEKRIIPRTRVVKLLQEKGLADPKCLLEPRLLTCSDVEFVKKYVTTNIHKIPNLMDVFMGHDSG